MDKFHKLLELVDKNASTIPEGDYIEICNIIKEIHEKVKPPPFLLDENEPVTMTPQAQAELMEDIRLMREWEEVEFMEALHRAWSEPVEMDWEPSA